MKFDVMNRWSGDVQFVAEIKCKDDASYAVKLGLAFNWAIMSGADLTGAYLTGADLTGADLTGADLTGADLTGADLTGADLTGADLTGADLTGADLTGADLTGADLTGANLTGAKNSELAIAKTRILPEGSIIGWKKCRNCVIVKLRIPEAAKRINAFGRKCRAEYVEVIEVIGAEFGVSSYDGKTEYRFGATVYPDKFDENWKDECSSGIHFFITRAEAEAY